MGAIFSALRKKKPPETPAQTGIQILCSSQQPVVDICFVHGLGGHRLQSWTAPNQTIPWPQKLLPHDVANARIITYGYPADVKGRGATLDGLLGHSSDFLHSLAHDRTLNNATGRPIILIAHSLGGLICKKAIQLSHADSNRQDLFRSLRAIAFMGTPHRAAWLAECKNLPLNAMVRVRSTKTKLIDVLNPNTAVLGSISSAFDSILRDLQKSKRRKIRIICFYENRSTTGKHTVVVSRESAIMPESENFAINADHVNMDKFSSRSDPGYIELARFLTEEIRASSTAGPTFSSDMIEKFKESLWLSTMGDRFRHIHGAARGTCTWLLKNAQYMEWRQSRRCLLRIYGHPGSGKSTLLKYAFQQDKSEDNRSMYFFFTCHGTLHQDMALELFRSLAYEILVKMPDTIPNLADAYGKHHNQSVTRPVREWKWGEAELQEYIKTSLAIVLQTQSVWLYIDAINEGGKNGERKILEWIQDLFEEFNEERVQRQVDFRICVTCRYFPMIPPRNLSSCIDIQIPVERYNREDMEKFVKTELSKIGSLEPMEEQLRDIVHHSGGIFQWADSVTGQIVHAHDNGGRPERRVSRLFQNFYVNEINMMIRNTNDQTPNSLCLLQWIAYAIRPLTVQELKWAMSVPANCRHTSHKDYRDYSQNEFERWLLGMGRVLVTVDMTLGRAVVQFINPTAKNLVLGSGLPALRSRIELASASDMALAATTAKRAAHDELARICLRYLATEEVRGSQDPALPFLNYASQAWIEHLKQSNSNHETDDKNDFRDQQDIVRLFSPETSDLMAQWIRVLRRLPPQTRSLAQPPDGTTLVHVLAENGIVRLLRAYLDTDRGQREIYSLDGDGHTPLSLARRNGHEAVVQLLVSRGAIDHNPLPNGQGSSFASSSQNQMNQYDTVGELIYTKYENREWKGKGKATAERSPVRKEDLNEASLENFVMKDTWTLPGGQGSGFASSSQNQMNQHDTEIEPLHTEDGKRKRKGKGKAIAERHPVRDEASTKASMETLYTKDLWSLPDE